LFPYILPHQADWRLRYKQYNLPGEYHNGGVWPFVCGFYVAACVAAGQMELAERKLIMLTELVKPWHENEAEWGFNEWVKAQTGQPKGRDWQTWSAAMYLYAAQCVQQRGTPFFSDIRTDNPNVADSLGPVSTQSNCFGNDEKPAFKQRL
jgi:glycogen debranching enzyme